MAFYQQLIHGKASSIWVLFLGAISVGLVSVGACLAVNDRTSSATMTLGFGILFSILVMISKFKKFEGLGFKAEMWEQEFVRAGELVAQLEVVSASVIEQLALLAATMGLASGGVSISEKERLLEQLEQLADKTGLNEDKKTTFLRPLIERMCREYCWDIDWKINEKLKDLRNQFKTNRQSPLYASSIEAWQEIETLKKQICSVNSNYMLCTRKVVVGSSLDFDTRNNLWSITNIQTDKFAILYAKLKR